ncbi:MAG: ATP-binding cassette domain-containing protein [Candidatus Limnocylindria bacterium]
MAGRGATVELRHVSKRYGPAAEGHGAVNDLSLAVDAGGISVLVGPSGCGKTTTLKMVNRLIEPTSGQILIDGEDVAASEPTALRRRIGYVIQQVGLFPHQTIGENVATVPDLLGWPRRRIAARVDELLDLVGLAPDRYRDRYPAQLSGGERQRVGVARALAAEPPVMLMDEPFGAVDPIVRERLQDEFLRIHARLGTTVLFVTHDIDEAIKMGDRVAVMDAGRLIQYAPPAELLTSPANDFVARFVGADRGLKRLSLTRVGDVRLREVPTAREGETIGARRAGHLLLLDASERPIGWVNVRRLPADAVLGPSLADPSSPAFARDTRLRDALSMLLAAGVRTGVVVDDDGRYLGALALDDISQALTE